MAATLPRETIFLAQTPQAFRRDVLRAAIAIGRTGIDVTDEAALAERAGHPVRLVEGEPTNIKITTREDLAFAQGLLASRREGDVSARVGTGYDLHRLVEGRPLILGGVTIPFTHGLAGHSDADAVCHAVTDAILGAAGAGDIGRHFPDSDPQWRGAVESRPAVACRRSRARGRVPRRERRRGRDCRAPEAGAARDRRWPPTSPPPSGSTPAEVSIKGKTNEGIGELGRGEAIAVHAVAMVRKTGL